MARYAETYDVVIVGGGLIGLCAASHLVGARQKIAVITGTHQGRASLAAAGMLAPTCEWNPEMPLAFFDLLRAGRDYYREFVPQLLAGPDRYAEIGYSTTRFLLLDLVENENGLEPRYEGLRAAGAHVDWLTADEAAEREPGINPEAIQGAILIADDGIVNPRALHALLLERLAQQGVALLECNLTSVAERGVDFELALDNGTVVQCPRVVVAAGAWSSEVAGLFHLDVPVCPAKGQIVKLHGASGLLNSVLFMPAGACGCLMERAPGVYLAGTSEEYVSGEVSNTSRVVAAILTRINDVFYPAGDFAIEDMWSGFRPITPDELPIIGPSSDQRVIVATGHFRNGVLLAPLTGRIVASLLAGVEPALNLQPYRADRRFQPQYRYASAY